jgi:hypothetical protein
VVVLIGGFSLTSVYGQATTSTVQFTTPVNTGVTYSCGGIFEHVSLTGSINTVLHTTRDASGGVHIIDGHTNFQGLSGTGDITGTRYNFAGGVTPISSIGQDSANTLSFLAHGRLISQGQQENQLASTQFHVTFNANGQPTATVENFVFQCTG